MTSVDRARCWGQQQRRRQRTLALALLVALTFGLIQLPAGAQDNEPLPGNNEDFAEFGGTSQTEPEDGGVGTPPSDTSGQESPEEGLQLDPAALAEATAGPIEREVAGAGDGVQVLDVDTSDYPNVDVVVAVPPALAGELFSDSFSLTENGQPRGIDVAKLRDVLEVVLVIDTSGSMEGEPLDAAKAAASDFVESLEDATKVAVVSFGASARTEVGFAGSRDAAIDAIDGLEASGETAMYDALTVAADEFDDPAAQRFVIVLSDGTDTASSATIDDAAVALITSDANLYAITLESDDADFTGLIDLSAELGGQLISAADADELSATYADIATRLANQYQLSYHANAGGQAKLGIAVDANDIIAVASYDLRVPGVVTSELTTVDGDPLVTPPQPIDTSDPVLTKIPDATGFANSDNAIYIGGGILFFAIALAIFLAASAEPRGPSAFERLNFKPTKPSRSGLASIADRASVAADRILEKQEKRGALDSALERAGMDMRPGEYIMAVIGVAFGAAFFGAVMFAPLVGGVLFFVALFGGRTWVNMKASRRQKKFGNQLGDTLMMIAGSLRAGHGIVESIDTVAAQADAPTGEEFSRAVAEARIGRDMVESLYDIAERTQSEDFIWVVRAIGINRELGGDLAEILDNVGETIRDRNRLRDQVKALSAEGKVSAIILFVLPIGVGGWVRMSNPQYLDAMTSQTAGKFLMGGAVFMLFTGGMWLKKLVNVEF